MCVLHKMYTRTKPTNQQNHLKAKVNKIIKNPHPNNNNKTKTPQGNTTNKGSIRKKKKKLLLL